MGGREDNEVRFWRRRGAPAALARLKKSKGVQKRDRMVFQIYLSTTKDTEW